MSKNSYESKRHIVSSLIERYSQDSDDALKLWGSGDKQFYFSPQEESVIAYASVNGVAFALGDPIGCPESAEHVIASFTESCLRSRLTPVIIHGSEKWERAYRLLGYKKIYTGVDAHIKTEDFFKHTSRNKHFRNIRNRFQKANYRVCLNVPPYKEDFLSQLRRVSDEWLSVHGGKEFTFVTGGFEEDYVNACQLYTLESASGEIIAFANLLQPTVEGRISTDLMRFVQSAPRGAMDFLLCGMICSLYTRGFVVFDLGFAPMVKSVEGCKTPYQEKWRQIILKGSSGLVSFEGLTRYKKKFEPIWYKRYIYYKGSSIKSPIVIAAFIKLLLF